VERQHRRRTDAGRRVRIPPRRDALRRQRSHGVEVQRGRQPLEVPGIDPGQALEERRQLLRTLRVRAGEHRVGHEPVAEDVGEPGPRDVGLGAARGLDRRQSVDETDPAPHLRRPQRLDGDAVAEQLVVQRGQGVQEAPRRRRLPGERVPLEHHGGRLVERDPVVDAVAQLRADVERQVAEAERGVAVHPAGAEGGGGVAVVQGQHHADPCLGERVEQAVVEADPAAVQRPPAVGLHARPREREPQLVRAEIDEQGEILAPAQEEVGRDLGRRLLGDGAAPQREVVPHGSAPAAGLERSLGLEGALRQADPQPGGQEPSQLARVVEARGLGAHLPPVASARRVLAHASSERVDGGILAEALSHRVRAPPRRTGSVSIR